MLLSPCLIADPALAQGFFAPTHLSARAPALSIQSAFEEQALTLVLGDVVPSILSIVGKRQRRNETRLARNSETSRPKEAISLFRELIDQFLPFKFVIKVWRTPEGFPFFAFPSIRHKDIVKPVQFMEDQSQVGGRSQIPDPNENESIVYEEGGISIGVGKTKFSYSQDSSQVSTLRIKPGSGQMRVMPMEEAMGSLSIYNRTYGNTREWRRSEGIITDSGAIRKRFRSFTDYIKKLWADDQGSGWEFFTLFDNSNTFGNPNYLAFVDGRIYHGTGLEGDTEFVQDFNQPFLSLVQHPNGRMEMIEVVYEIDQQKSGLKDDGIYRKYAKAYRVNRNTTNGWVKAEELKGVQAFNGIPIIRNGQSSKLTELIHVGYFSDFRHVVSIPPLQSDQLDFIHSPEKRATIVAALQTVKGGLYFGSDQLNANGYEKLARAVNGPVLLDNHLIVSIEGKPQSIPLMPSEVKAIFERANYREVSSLPQNPGEIRLAGENQVEIYLKTSPYPMLLYGETEKGEIIVQAVGGLSGRTGIAIKEIPSWAQQNHIQNLFVGSQGTGSLASFAPKGKRTPETLELVSVVEGGAIQPGGKAAREGASCAVAFLVKTENTNANAGESPTMGPTTGVKVPPLHAPEPGKTSLMKGLARLLSTFRNLYERLSPTSRRIRELQRHAQDLPPEAVEKLMRGVVSLDASKGEGGGAAVRLGVGLSILTDQPVSLHNVRLNRGRPGLKSEHVAYVYSGGLLSPGAAFVGNAYDSLYVGFIPGQRSPGGRQTIDIQGFGYRNAPGLVSKMIAQVGLPLMLFAHDDSSLTVKGFTHRLDFQDIPPEHLQDVILPILSRMGAQAKLTIERYGMNRAGRIVLHTRRLREPLRPLDLTSRGRLEKISVRIVCNHSSRAQAEAMAERLRMILRDQTPLGETPAPVEVHIQEADSTGRPLFAECTFVFESTRIGINAMIQDSTRIDESLDRFQALWNTVMHSSITVDEHTADILLLYMALARGHSRFLAPSLSPHFETTAYVVERMLGARVHTQRLDSGEYLVEIDGVGLDPEGPRPFIPAQVPEDSDLKDLGDNRLVVTLEDPSGRDSEVVGSKMARLAVMHQGQVPVPETETLTTAASEWYLRDNGLVLDDAAPDDLPVRIINGVIPLEIERSIRRIYRHLNPDPRSGRILVARSSNRLEDLLGLSFSGIYESVTDIASEKDALRAGKAVIASAALPRARAYLRKNGIPLAQARMAVGYERKEDARFSGVAFTADPVTGEIVLIVETIDGTAEALVDGKVPVDHYRLDPETGDILSLKTAMGGRTLLSLELRHSLAEMLRRASALFPDWPLGDYEYVFRRDGSLIIVQGRPATVAEASKEEVEVPSDGIAFEFPDAFAAFAGTSRGVLVDLDTPQRGYSLQGRTAIVMTREFKLGFLGGDIHHVTGILTDMGSLLSHAANQSREARLPSLVGSGRATEMLTPYIGQEIIVDSRHKRVYVPGLAGSGLQVVQVGGRSSGADLERGEKIVGLPGRVGEWIGRPHSPASRFTIDVVGAAFDLMELMAGFSIERIGIPGKGYFVIRKDYRRLLEDWLTTLDPVSLEKIARQSWEIMRRLVSFAETGITVDKFEAFLEAYVHGVAMMNINGYLTTLWQETYLRDALARHGVSIEEASGLIVGRFTSEISRKRLSYLNLLNDLQQRPRTDPVRQSLAERDLTALQTTLPQIDADLNQRVVRHAKDFKHQPSLLDRPHPIQLVLESLRQDLERNVDAPFAPAQTNMVLRAHVRQRLGSGRFSDLDRILDVSAALSYVDDSEHEIKARVESQMKDLLENIEHEIRDKGVWIWGEAHYYDLTLEEVREIVRRFHANGSDDPVGPGSASRKSA